MHQSVMSATLRGVDAHLVEVEVDIAGGLPSFHTVGLAEAAVREARVRVQAAIDNSGLAFPAGPWTNREWFFNPFGWQLVFFTGFALMAGWIPQPPSKTWLILLAVVIVVATVPFAYFRILRAVPELRAIAGDISFLTKKTDFGLLRYVHFMALAYLGWAAAGEGGKRLMAKGQGMLAGLAILFCAMVIDRIIQGHYKRKTQRYNR